jgi:aldehyde dehydrogenase (NAD+)
MIDICDFAVGLSRQLHGLTIASERPGHRMMEQWLPLGVVGIISAFNFPVAVWAWNSALALVCGDACVWKPSETPLTALATQALFDARSAYRAAAMPRPTACPAAHRPRRGRGAGGRRPRGWSRPPAPPAWAAPSAARGGALRPLPAGTGRQQRHHRDAQRRPGAGRARHLFGAYGTAGQRCTTTRA